MIKKKTICTEDNKVAILHGGSGYFDRLCQLINSAQKTIHLQYYIFEDDETGNLILSQLIQAAERGVKIYLVLDGFASQGFKKHKSNDLIAKGLKIKFFNPLIRSNYFYFGRRLHHKIFVVDQQVGIIGGINISNNYNDIHDHVAWLDYAVEVEGPIVNQLCVLCWKTIYNFPKFLKKTDCELYPTIFPNLQGHGSYVCMHRNDWVRRKIEIFSTYHTLIKQAEQEIILMSSYFLPGISLRRLLAKASARGVKVRVIVANKSDVGITKNAERWLYDWLLRNKIEVYELKTRILHAKCGLCDTKWFTLGSYNINDLSAYASIELNLSIYNTVLTNQLKSELHNTIENDCIYIDPYKFAKERNMLEQFYQFLNYHLVRFILFIFTFYFTQKHR